MQPHVSNGQSRLVAPRLHLAVFLWIQIWMAASGASILRWVVSTTDPNAFHVRLVCCYLLMLAWEWSLFCFVWLGMKKTGVSLRAIIGGKWLSVWDVARDIGTGLAFWLLWMVALMVFAKLSGPRHRTPEIVRAMLPRTGLEFALWIGLSATAGFCEEVMYRGYLQQQFLAMSRSLPVTIVGQGLLFGFVHIYQGLFAAITISIIGMLFGSLAAWRKSLRPGIVAHAWYDGIIGVVLYLMYVLHHIQ